MFKIKEVWSLKVKPSDLYNIERVPEDKPDNGGGHTYFQIPKRLVESTLDFLRTSYPQNGQPIVIQVLDINKNANEQTPVELEFSSKSQERMRINRQNRHTQQRLPAWSNSRGFPTLAPFEDSEVAKSVLESVGEVHIFLIRDDLGKIWAGFTKGTPNSLEAKQPFSDILWGNVDGGIWKC
ncbi:hypothetical protein [Alteromonas australica]|uniref:hypothetical protein n=1 Tax=Alteromonas australica TaxID=589873 RepID=UPI0035C7C82C